MCKIPFTPFGDASLLRMANFYANVAHAAVSEFDACLDLVTDLPARLMNLQDYGITVGNPADLVVLDTDSGRERDCRTARRADGVQERPPGVRAAAGRRCFRRTSLLACAICAPAAPAQLTLPSFRCCYRTTHNNTGQET